MQAGPVRFAILCVLGYVAASWVMRFDTGDGTHNASLTYPFDTFSMYAGTMPSSAARMVVRTGDGSFRRIDEYHAFDCDPPIDHPLDCDDAEGGASIPYVDHDAAHWIVDHGATDPPGAGAERIEIVRRSWSLSDDAVTSVGVCVLTTCTAAP
jgi:hypothetical protein